MKARELRLGNWVTQPNRIGQVSEVWSDAVRIDGYSNGYDYEHTHPIPITEEILLKCGHKLRDGRTGSGFIQIGQYDFEVNTYTAKVCTVRYSKSTHGITFPCEYLHQLQNIVAITEQELTYTP